MVKPFEFIDAISHSKEDLIRNDESPDTAEKGYDPFLTNRAFSYHTDSLLLANEMNRYPFLPKRLQHDFYLHVLRKRKRYASWAKKDNSADRDLIASLLQCNKRLADAYLKILTEEQLAALKTQYSEGGVSRV